MSRRPRFVLSLAATLVIAATLSAQDVRGRTCGTQPHHEALLAKDPEYRARREQLEAFTRTYVTGGRTKRAALKSGIITIPVVVHVLWHTATENVSDAQIFSQIATLNEDFRKLNADVTSAPDDFEAIAADCRIEFQLAARDPDCQPTEGITRTETSVTGWIYDENADPMKFAASGGHDAWPADEYLNLWVVKFDDSTLGYAAFPGGPANIDGVVIDFRAFGNTGTADAPFDLGRTATHEIGHWLNLFHIWGDDGSACSGSDEVDDTPNQAGANIGCPSFPHVTCSNAGDMSVNYMDYTDDACMLMFTEGQSVRMDAALFGSRADILGSDALTPPTGPADVWMADMGDDIGDEPNTISDHMYLTEDIWARQQADGLTNQEHENPQFGLATNHLYVRVRNRGCDGPAEGTLKLYWAKASSGLSWPAPWDGSISPPLMGQFIGEQPTGSVPAAGFVILDFPWSPPNPADYASFGADKSHFCVLARIETSSSAPFGMTFAETSNLEDNVRNNNNIVWKNISILDDTGAKSSGSMTAGDTSGDGSRMKLAFDATPIAGQKLIQDWGRVKVDLGKELFASWDASGRKGAGVAVLGGSLVEVLAHGAWLGDMAVGPNKLYPLRIDIDPPAHPPLGADVYWLDVAQLSQTPAGDARVGGQLFVMKTHGQPPGHAPPGHNGGGVGDGACLWCWILVVVLILLLLWLLFVRRRG